MYSSPNGAFCTSSKRRTPPPSKYRGNVDLTEAWKFEEGDSPKRDLRALLIITEIVSRFDVVALQEVRGNIEAPRHMLKALGPH